jgi:predicted GNAT superfamily acetyltransferase
MNDEITIRRAETVADYQACQRAQRNAWGITDESYVVPVATMVGAQHHGGLVLGAFLPDGRAVGMSFAFLGRTEGRLCLYSQLTGVVPGYQDKGIGHRLKTTQRAIARDEQVPCIAWAFDPLQAGNARFNLDKLGATAGRYVVDMYGPRSDALNRNTPTDRLIAVWETADAPPRPATDPAKAWGHFPRIVASKPAGGSWREPSPPGSDAQGPEGVGPLLLEVPADVNRLRAERPDLAERWGLAVRQGFVDAFAAGYRAVGFLRDYTPEGRRCAYVLERATRP